MALAFSLLAAACLVLAAASDIRSYRIPNFYPAAIILLFVAARVFWGFSPVDWEHLVHFLAALGVGMLLFRIGWVGGGDAKLYAAAALWFAGADAAKLLLATVLSGLFLAIFYFVTRRMWRRENPERKLERRIPYGIAIAMGAIIAGGLTGPAELVTGKPSQHMAVSPR